MGILGKLVLLLFLRSSMPIHKPLQGGVRVGFGDGNFDGILELITGAGHGGGPQVNAFSLSDLALLFSFYSGEASNASGVYVG